MTVDEQPASAPSTELPAAGARSELEQTPATLLIPGLRGSAKQWQPLMRHLPRDHKTITPDLPGIGESGERGPYTLAAVSARLADSVAAAASGPVDVIGHDWGATLAIALAATRPDLVRRLVVISGGWPPGLAAGPDQPEPGMRRSAWLVANRPSRQEGAALRRARREYLSADHTVVGRPMPERSLVVWGAHDRMLRPRSGEKVVTALGRCVDPATVEMITLPKVGHLPHVTAAEAVGPLLCDFLLAA